MTHKWLLHLFCAPLFFTFCTAVQGPFEQFNTTYDIASKDGKRVYIKKELVKEIEQENSEWHWYPYLKTRTELIEDVITRVECIGGDSIESFPDGWLTEEQLKKGGLILYVLFGIYAFTLLAYVCNDYFIPTVEIICETLKIPQNVAAATFMSVATSCPEFFVNVISTFVTQSDMGIGTIVGSAIFNALGVAAIGGIAATKPIPIDRRPVTRDVLIYMFNISVLVTIVWDGEVIWYEALVLGILYIMYFILMFNSTRIFRLYDRLFGNCCNKKSVDFSNENGKMEPSEDPVDIAKVNQHEITDKDEIANKGDEMKPKKGIWIFPKEQSILRKLWWFYTWPLKFLLSITIPSPEHHRKFYPVTFIMCIVWIGVNSYFVSWTMTVIGHTFMIPDSVMGMTFLAFGGCLPEACAIFIMSRRGEGGIGVSNALGANSLAILFALGLPWLIKTLTLLTSGADVAVIYINSSGIDFVVGSLLVAVTCLWITLYLGKFTLKRIVGGVLLCLYLVFVTFAILVEMGIIIDRDIPFC